MPSLRHLALNGMLPGSRKLHECSRAHEGGPAWLQLTSLELLRREYFGDHIPHMDGEPLYEQCRGPASCRAMLLAFAGVAAAWVQWRLYVMHQW